MHRKRVFILALLAIIVNAVSLYNAVMAVWSLVLYIFSIFLLNSRDNDRLPQDKKVFGFIQLWMLGGIFLLSTGMGGVGFFQLWFIMNEHFSPIVPLSIVLAVIGFILYYYLLIKMIQEAYGVFRQKQGHRLTAQNEAAKEREDNDNGANEEHEAPYGAAQRTREARGKASKMKARYIILLAFLSVLVNFLSVYNVYLGICSIFLLLIVSITALFVTLVNRANKVAPKRRNIAARNLSYYGTQKPTQITNRIGMIFGLFVVYAGGVLLTIVQVNEREQLHHFLSTHFQFANVHFIAHSLSVLGYALFVIALLLSTIYCLRAFRSEQMFVGKQG